MKKLNNEQVLNKFTAELVITPTNGSHTERLSYNGLQFYGCDNTIIESIDYDNTFSIVEDAARTELEGWNDNYDTSKTFVQIHCIDDLDDTNDKIFEILL